MPLDFPSSPSNGQTYPGPGGITWVYDGTKWVIQGASGTYLPLTGGVLASPGNLTVRGGILGGAAGTVPAAGCLTLNANTVAPAISPALPATLWSVQANNSYNSILLDSFGPTTANFYAGRNARGTAAAPTATQSGDTLVAMLGYGYSGASYFQQAQVQLSASENWTGSARGTQAIIYTVPPGTTAGVASLTLAGNTATFSAGVTIDNTGVGGRITATNGFRSQSGSGGAQQGNVFNLQWPGGGSFHLWVDTTDTGSINVTPCDERLKTNLKAPTVDALGAINGIALKQFDWLANDLVPEHHEDLGFTAQQLAKVIPGAVDLHEDTPDQMASVQLTPIVAHLIGAVQKLSAEIDTLKKARK